MTVGGDQIVRAELFEETDIDAALSRFDELHRQERRLENAATRVAARYAASFANRDWVAVEEQLSQDFSIGDRRPVVNAEMRRGREAEIKDLQAAADVGFAAAASVTLATRGEHLFLARARFSSRDEGHGFENEFVTVVEIDANERMAAVVVFDTDDIDAAFAELDARYLAGEPATHANTWSAVKKSYDALNRRELPTTTADWVNIDHRRGTLVAPGDILANVHATWDLASDIRRYAVAVHRLNDLGAVVSHAANWTTQQGFDAEWRIVILSTVEGDLVNRCEIFDESDIDVALARFDELTRPVPLPHTPRLESAVSRVCDRFISQYAARDWDAICEMLADDYYSDDRRRVVGAGVRRGRDAEIINMRAIADLWITNMTSSVIATRGERLILTRARYSGHDQRPEAFNTEVLGIVEIDDHERIVARVGFDPDDIAAAFTELDARYLAGEAAAHSRTWSAINDGFTALNRHEMPATSSDFVDVDHRRGVAFAPGELMRYLRAGWEVNRETRSYVEAVHRLNDLGAVVTHTAQLTSREGFDADWRTIEIFTVEGNSVNRAEIFDEADLDTALARFDELHPQVCPLENTASQVSERLQACFAARDWKAMAELLAEDIITDDRRRVVRAGARHGRDAMIADISGLAEIGVRNIASNVIATRGERLVLSRSQSSGGDEQSEAFYVDALDMLEIDADQRVVAHISFEVDDVDAAHEELDARYLASEAAAHAHTWSVIAHGYAALNRHELAPMAPDFVNVDHRPGIAFAPGDLAAYLRAGREITPEGRIYIEAVLRLSDLGAVVAHVVQGTSGNGFAAEWREIALLTVDADELSRFELFDESDLDAALMRFGELPAQKPA
jgi:hypothetical protein